MREKKNTTALLLEREITVTTGRVRARGGEERREITITGYGGRQQRHVPIGKAG